MQHHHIALGVGRSTSTNDEARSTANAAGPKANQVDRADFIRGGNAIQALEDFPNPFNRLAKQFQALGLALYPLSGDTLMVSSPAFGMERVLPDLRAARIYLQQIGGRHVL
jgi:hypothetical protein